jgi:hypothetical protein
VYSITGAFGVAFGEFEIGIMLFAYKGDRV